MKKLIALLLLLPFAANAETFEARYGVAENFSFKLFSSDGTLDTDEVDGGAEVSISCDNGAETTASNDFVDEGTFYSIALTATEMECAKVDVVIAATVTNVFHITTFGDLNSFDPSQGSASGVSQSATSTTLVLDAGTNIGNDILNNKLVHITGGTGAGQTRLIDDWVQSTDTLTVTAAWGTTPDATSEYLVTNNNQADVASVSATTAAAVWEIACGTPTASTVREQLCDDVDDLITNDASQTAAISTAISNSEAGFLFSAAVDSTTQTTITVDGSVDPGADDAHVGRLLCVSDANDSFVQDCARITDYVSSTNTFTIESAMYFTVAATDTITIRAPSSNLLGSDEITAGVIAGDAIGAAEIAASAIGASEIATDAIDDDSIASDVRVESNVKEVNDVAISGAGTTGDPWGPTP